MESKHQLELEDAMPHHETAWKVKRVAWLIMALLILAGLSGLLGSGPLSDQKVHGDNGLILSYNRFARYHAPTQLGLVVPGGTGELRLSINSEFLNSVELESVHPDPFVEILDGQNYTWIFRRDTSREGSTIQIMFRPDRFGRKAARIKVGEFGSFKINPLFLP